MPISSHMFIWHTHQSSIQYHMSSSFSSSTSLHEESCKMHMEDSLLDNFLQFVRNRSRIPRMKKKNGVMKQVKIFTTKSF